MTRLPTIGILLFGLALRAAAGGTAIGELRLGRGINEARCAVTGSAHDFDARTAQVFLQFIARGVAAGDSVRIDWLTPAGGVHDSAEYEALPAAPAFCFTSALQVAGAPASAQPGEWRVRVAVNGATRDERPFRIKGPPDDGSPRILDLKYLPAGTGEARIELQTWRASAETSVNLARFRPNGGWEYIAHLLPDALDGARMSVTLPVLDPARYMVVLRAPDGRISPPAPLELLSGAGYYLPGLTGEAWRITQRPYGTFSHWGRSIHAWDLAPVRSRIITAMRGGVVHAYDRGEGQNVRSRSFGNYITIDHGDGEYSHYAHLRTGAFFVRTGDRVAAGQPLAEVGNSGYSFGTHVHVHVTRAFPIASPSIPFQFADLPEGRAAVVVARNAFAGAPANVAAPQVGGRPPRWQGAVAFSAWWSEGLNVPRGTREMELRQGAREGQAGVDLHAVSPSGRRYTLTAAEADETLRIERPEAGNWRVWVQAVQGSGAEIAFWVDADLKR